MPVRIIIAEDEPLVLQALAALIDRQADFELVGSAMDADGAIAIARSGTPDIAILDVKMPGGGGARAAREIKVVSPATKIIAYSAYDDRATVLEMVKAGAIGYLVKGNSGAEIIEAISRAMQGQSAISSEVAGEVLKELAGKLEREDRQARTTQEQIERVRSAIEGNGIRSVFQPIVHLASGETIGFEALTRFDGPPERPPYVWFTEASSVGLGVDLDLVACLKALECRQQLPAAMRLSVNIGPGTIVDPRFLESMEGRDLKGVIFEVTEHAPVDDYVALASVVASIRGRGAALAVDDAGAGFASLRHILRLDPEVVKLDIGITQGIYADTKKRALAAALISFAGEIGAAVIAEGIEQASDVDALTALGVEFGQGYLFGRPAELPKALYHPNNELTLSSFAL